MSKVSSDWNVLSHGGIERLTERLWRVQGALPGMSLERVMTVVRRENGGLVIHSAIALRARELAEVEAWGTPEVLPPRGSRDKVQDVVRVDGAYEDVPSDAVVQLFSVPGTGEREGAMLVRSEDGTTVVLNDIVMNMDRRRDLPGLFFTTVLGSAPGPRVSRLAKLALVKDKPALRAELLRLAALPDLARVIVSHDKVSTGRAEARATLEQAATYL
jgi:hypothetical protein